MVLALARSAVVVRQTTPMPVQRLLVANRGEIAVRVFRTCRELGIETVAVAAPDDVGAFHTRSADRVVEIGSYLSAEDHIGAAKEANADAIHPGYGFLAENAGFAQAVEAARLTWIGPPPDALRAGGGQVAAKRIAREAGVPVLPDGAPDESVPARRESGRGRRRTWHARRPLGRASSTARSPPQQREALAAFGDGTASPSNVIANIRATSRSSSSRDAHGTSSRFGERDCSIQRRHQKILEEAPSPRSPVAAVREQLPRPGAGASQTCRVPERRDGRVPGRRFHRRRGCGHLPRGQHPRLQVEHRVTKH